MKSAFSVNNVFVRFLGRSFLGMLGVSLLGVLCVLGVTLVYMLGWLATVGITRLGVFAGNVMGWNILAYNSIEHPVDGFFDAWLFGLIILIIPFISYWIGGKIFSKWLSYDK